MTQALYRKWRPQTFDQVVGQEHVTQTLRNALALGRVGHAYLFAGMRGTGKTTMARLVAKAVNCLAEDVASRPCNACGVCQAVNEGRFLDLIEIDAASHTSVDDVRELRDKVGFRPNEGRYKVYIIDEVHRFSGSAFDALLKTIEEPPEHAIFILATTEIHKVPETILSRCQRFDFRRIPVQQIVQRLETLADAEGIGAELEALTLIARSATGSLRDAESLLDQLAAANEGVVSLVQVQATLGTIDAALVAGLVGSLVAHDVGKGLDLIDQALDQGADLRQFTRQIIDHLRGMLLVQLQGTALLDLTSEALQALQVQAGQISTPDLVWAIKRFSEAEAELKGGWQPQLPLELALVEASIGSAREETESPAAASRAVLARDAPWSEKTNPQPDSTGVQPGSSAPIEAVTVSAEREERDAADSLTLDVVRERWPEVLGNVRVRDKSIQALLNSTHPIAVQESGRVTLGVAHEFAQNKLSQGRARRLVEEVLGDVFSQSCQVEYQVVASPEEASTSETLTDETSSVSGPAPDTDRNAPPDTWTDDPVVRAAKQMGAEVRPIDEGR